MLSFICASNRPDVLKNCVVSSLEKQKDRDFELVVVDTSSKHYVSAVEALNEGADRAKGDYFVFLHQDVQFEDEDFVSKLRGYIERGSFFIAGVAGAVPAKTKWRKRILTNIINGDEKVNPGIPIPDDSIISCNTVDECLFVIPRDVYARRPLTEYVPTWHLYAVEYCLWAEQSEPGSVKIFPLRLWHQSDGASFDASYYTALNRIIGVYKGHYKVLYTTMGAWPASVFLRGIRGLIKRIVLMEQKIRGSK